MSLPRATLARYITPGCTFVETGTRWGDRLIAAYELGAGRVFSCETDGVMCDIARRHVADAIRGDVLCEIFNYPSVKLLADVLYEYPHREAVVFLDAHTESHSPVIEELNVIASWKFKPRVILIDDMRLMPGWGISVDGLRSQLDRMGYDVTYDDGIEKGDVMVGRLKA